MNGSPTQPLPVPLPIDSTLHLPADMNYGCVRCGHSCGEFWEIFVEPEKVAEIEARDPAALRAAGAGEGFGGPASAATSDPTHPIIDSPWTPGKPIMRLNACNHCVLQTGEGLCSLHTAFGLESKPNTCRSFPFKFVQTPRGSFAGLSFACTAVLLNSGPAVGSQRPDLEQQLGWTDSKRPVEQPSGLAADLPLSWDQYDLLETDLNELLDPAFGPLPRRLLAQSAYLAVLAKFLRTARTERNELAAGPEANDEPLRVFRARMRSAGAETPVSAATAPQLWPLQFSLADKRRGSLLLRRMFLGFAHALRNTYGERRGRLRSYILVVGTYFKYATGRGRLTLPFIDKTLHWKELAQIKFDPTRPEFDELLTRYFRHRLFRKDLLTADYLHLGHHLMLMHWGLIHWYSALYAAAAGRQTIELEDLQEGLRNVEKFFVFHSTFNQLFARYPLMRGFLDRVFHHPLFAFSMAWGEWA